MPTSSTSCPSIEIDVLQQAANWMARLWSEEASEQDFSACAQWRAAHPDHERAWQHLELFQSKLNYVPRDLARQVLREPTGPARANRRNVLRLIGLGVVTGGAYRLLQKTDTWQYATATQSTRTGEIRHIVLTDGTQVCLGPNSALDVRFDAKARVLELQAGEIFVTTAHEKTSIRRPLSVRTHHGVIEALGTRFNVRLEADTSRVNVYEGMVEARPALAPRAAVKLLAGEGCSFSANDCGPKTVASVGGESWTHGVLLAENMRVSDFLTELRRYRSGVLYCAPAVGELRVSGVFSLRDTDRALHNLSLALPVSVVYRTRYWVSVTAI